MTFEKSPFGWHSLKLAFAAALWVTACGGSAFFESGSAGAGASGSAGHGAGAVGSGGSSAAGAGGHICNVACPLVLCDGTPVIKPGECCATCDPGGGGGSGGASGGATSSAGSPGMCTVACTLIGCGPGFKSVIEPGACCPTCVPDGSGGGCGGISCPAIKCAAGYKSEQQAGACCPTCVPDNSCAMGQQGYSSLRQKLLAQPDVSACTVSKDCTLLANNFYCGDQCAQIPVSVAASQSIENELSGYAKNNCSTCSPIYPPCAAPVPPACVRNVCVHGSFLN